MAYKMKGAPMYDTSSKHGTNANYKKSGPPNLLGKIFDPFDLKNKLTGGGKDNCPPQQQQQVIGGPKPVEPVTPNAVSNATTTNAPGMTENIDTTAQSAAGGATMKKGLKNGAPKKDVEVTGANEAREGRKKLKQPLVGKSIKGKVTGAAKYKSGAPKKIDPKELEPMERDVPHEIKHGEIKKKYIGGVIIKKNTGEEQIAETPKTPKTRRMTTETRRMTKRAKEEKSNPKTMATGGVKAMATGGAGKKVIGKMTRKLTNNLHKNK